MTRSLVVTTWFPDAQNPSRTPFCLAHVHALQAVGVDVEVIHVVLGGRAGHAVETYEGVRVRRVALRPHDPRTWYSTTRAIRRRLASVDVLHTMAFSSVLAATVPWVMRRRPWVHTEHWNGVVNPASVGGWWQRLALLRHALRLPHVVTGVTGELTREMARFARVGATTVVPCVVPPLDELVPFPPETPLRLVAVGLLNERKNPLVALDTVVWLASQGVDVRYEWVGEGPLLARAAARAAEAGLTDHVTFSGPVPPADVSQHISSAHLFFVPSTQENFFTAAAEAIVAGRPVVLPRSGGFVDYCGPENSVLVDDWEPESLGRAIIEARDRLRGWTPESVSASVGDRFSRASVGRSFLTAYQTAQRCTAPD